MSYEFKFNNNTHNKGLDFKLNYIKKAYPIPKFIEKNVAVDIGCNLAAFPIANKDNFKSIYAFEASYECFEYSFTNLKERNVKNCYLFNLAVHHSNGLLPKIKQHKSKDNGSNSIIEHQDWDTGIYHKVPSISLEGIFELCNIDRISYMKIDCEGSEYELLMNKNLENIDFISIEVHNQRPNESNMLTQYLKQFFNVFSFQDPRGAHPLYQFVNRRMAI